MNNNINSFKNIIIFLNKNKIMPTDNLVKT